MKKEDPQAESELALYEPVVLPNLDAWLTDERFRQDFIQVIYRFATDRGVAPIDAENWVRLAFNEGIPYFAQLLPKNKLPNRATIQRIVDRGVLVFKDQKQRIVGITDRLLKFENAKERQVYGLERTDIEAIREKVIQQPIAPDPSSVEFLHQIEQAKSTLAAAFKAILAVTFPEADIEQIWIAVEDDVIAQAQVVRAVCFMLLYQQYTEVSLSPVLIPEEVVTEIMEQQVTIDLDKIDRFTAQGAQLIAQAIEQSEFSHEAWSKEVVENLVRLYINQIQHRLLQLRSHFDRYADDLQSGDIPINFLRKRRNTLKDFLPISPLQAGDIPSIELDAIETTIVAGQPHIWQDAYLVRSTLIPTATSLRQARLLIPAMNLDFEGEWRTSQKLKAAEHLLDYHLRKKQSLPKQLASLEQKRQALIQEQQRLVHAREVANYYPGELQTLRTTLTLDDRLIQLNTNMRAAIQNPGQFELDGTTLEVIKQVRLAHIPREIAVLKASQTKLIERGILRVSQLDTIFDWETEPLWSHPAEMLEFYQSLDAAQVVSTLPASRISPIIEQIRTALYKLHSRTRPKHHSDLLRANTVDSRQLLQHFLQSEIAWRVRQTRTLIDIQRQLRKTKKEANAWKKAEIVDDKIVLPSPALQINTAECLAIIASRIIEPEVVMNLLPNPNFEHGQILIMVEVLTEIRDRFRTSRVQSVAELVEIIKTKPNLLRLDEYVATLELLAEQNVLSPNIFDHYQQVEAIIKVLIDKLKTIDAYTHRPVLNEKVRAAEALKKKYDRFQRKLEVERLIQQTTQQLSEVADQLENLDGELVEKMTKLDLALDLRLVDSQLLPELLRQAQTIDPDQVS